MITRSKHIVVGIAACLCLGAIALFFSSDNYTKGNIYLKREVV